MQQEAQNSSLEYFLRNTSNFKLQETKPQL